jgi:hypothetical protein
MEKKKQTKKSGTNPQHTVFHFYQYMLLANACLIGGWIY